MLRFLCVLLLASSALAERVTFETSDGMKIVADFQRAKKADAPSVICIPMYRSKRQSYRRLGLYLAARGLNVLAIDTRGHGESAPELRRKVEQRDAALFRDMYRDVEAAVAFLEEEKGCDPTRVALVGASVGCSVAIDTTVRNPHLVRAVVLLTPGAKYLGVPTLEHLARWPGTRVFTFVSNEEERVSRPVMDALAPFAASSHMVVPGQAIHGTRMFGKVPAIEGLIASFLEGSLLEKVDLRVPAWDADDPDLTKPGFFRRTLRLRRTVGGTTYSLMLYAAGERWTLGGLVDKPYQGRIRFLLGDEVVEFPFDTARKGGPKVPAARKKAVGEQASFRGTTWITFSPKQLADGALVALEFRSAKGESVRIPAARKTRFAARRQPVKRR